jgi:hypothetical protein
MASTEPYSKRRMKIALFEKEEEIQVKRFKTCDGDLDCKEVVGRGKADAEGPHLSYLAGEEGSEAGAKDSSEHGVGHGNFLFRFGD